MPDDRYKVIKIGSWPERYQPNGQRMKQAIKRKNFLYVQVSTYVDIYSLPKKKKKWKHIMHAINLIFGLKYQKKNKFHVNRFILDQQKQTLELNLRRTMQNLHEENQIIFTKDHSNKDF